MSDELGWALDDIKKAIRNEQPFGLTRVLWERVGGEGWALFRLENNSSFDDTLPQWNVDRAHGNFYAFFWSVPQEGMLSIRDKCTVSNMEFFESDANAVRWALELASKLTPEPDEAKPELAKDDIPF